MGANTPIVKGNTNEIQSSPTGTVLMDFKKKKHPYMPVSGVTDVMKLKIKCTARLNWLNILIILVDIT